MAQQRLTAVATGAGLIVAALLPTLLGSASLACEMLIFSMATLGCNLLLGYTGLLSFGQAIFFGIGAYATSLSLIHLGTGVLSSLALAMIVGGLAAAAVGALAIQRQGIYFVMLTLAFGQMFYFIAYTANNVTGGDNGLLGIPRPPLGLFGMPLVSLASNQAFYGLVVVLFVLVFMSLQRLTHSPFGSTLLAIRDNETRALALGYNTRYFKIAAFVVSGIVTALAGGLYATLLQFAPLSNIDLAMSQQILIMTIIGGTGSLFGSLFGATSIVLVSNSLSAIWPRWLLLLGMLLVAVVIFMRGGLWGGLEALYGLLKDRRRPGTMEPPEHSR